MQILETKYLYPRLGKASNTFTKYLQKTLWIFSCGGTFSNQVLCGVARLLGMLLDGAFRKRRDVIVADPFKCLVLGTRASAVRIIFEHLGSVHAASSSSSAAPKRQPKAARHRVQGQP